MFWRHTALQVQQERTQVVCSNKEAWTRLAQRHSRKIRHSWVYATLKYTDTYIYDDDDDDCFYYFQK
jgi:hypothetical protein